MSSNKSMLACVLWSSAFACVANANDRLADLDAYVVQARTQWQVPGLAIAIVKDGRVVLSRGYGVCKTDEESPVTKDTPFAIGSCTKSFTAAALAILVDDKKLGWDDPVRKHLPDFKLCDPFLTRETTIRDLLAHRTGLELADLLWSKKEFTPDEIMARLRHVQPKRSFRSRFTYNNLMYLVAGRIIEKVSGKPWSEFVRDAIVAPLGMQSTTLAFPDDATIAWPHAGIDGHVAPFGAERNYASAIAPAGSIWSTADDMAKWIRANLDAAGSEQHRLFHPNTLHEMHSPQSIIPVARQGSRYPAKEFASYGLGWFVEDYRGKTVVRKSGARNGFIAWVTMLPRERLGFVILANSHRTGINFALHHRILDAYLGKPEKDWSTIVLSDYTNGYYGQLTVSRRQYATTRETETKATLPTSKYAGTYRNDLFGDLTVRPTPNGMELRFGPRRVAPLMHWEHDTFEADFSNPAVEDWHVTFKVDRGRVESVRAVAAPWAPAWYDDGTVVGDFRRVVDPPGK